MAACGLVAPRKRLVSAAASGSQWQQPAFKALGELCSPCSIGDQPLAFVPVLVPFAALVLLLLARPAALDARR